MADLSTNPLGPVGHQQGRDHGDQGGKDVEHRGSREDGGGLEVKITGLDHTVYLMVAVVWNVGIE